MNKKEDTRKVYEEFFDHAMHLLNEHQLPVELIAGTMMAIAQRLYRTHLNQVEFDMMMDTIRDVEVKPYNVKKR